MTHKSLPDLRRPRQHALRPALIRRGDRRYIRCRITIVDRRPTLVVVRWRTRLVPLAIGRSASWEGRT
jgi:hypothetical protein